MNKKTSLLHMLPLCIAAVGALTVGARDVQAGPIELSVQPIMSSFSSGQSFDVEIKIAGLDSDDLSGFDFKLNFDPIVLQFQSYSLGVELADPQFGVFDLSDDSNVGAGELSLAEVSFLSDFSVQPEAFTLANVTFLAQQSGTSPLTLSNVELVDGTSSANFLAVSKLADGSVSIDSVPVPLPGTLLLMPLGLGLLAVRRLRRLG